MKTLSTILLVFFVILLQSCTTTDCPPNPPGNEDISGFIDGSTGILFTTATDKEDVLASLNAEEHETGVYRMPVFEIDKEQVYLLFQVAEVEHPYQYVDYQFADYCYGFTFQEFEIELMELIEQNDENLGDQFIIACGDVVGQLAGKEDKKEKNKKGKEQESLDKLKQNRKNKKALKKELSEKAKELGDAAKEALNNDDKETAKEKAKELIDETKYKFYLKYKYDFCDEWKLDFDIPYYWTEEETVIPPELIKEFSHQNIRYRVYKDAECGPGPPTIGLICFQFTPIVLDTLKPPPPPPAIWTTQEHLSRDVCVKGKGFCVEQEVVVLLEKDYSDSACTRLVNIRTFKDFACFK